nr:hypothetical protein GCM10020093_009160 [Planobispora longispora]
MSSRETVLARIRAALGGDVPPAAPSGTAEDSDSGRAAAPDPTGYRVTTGATAICRPGTSAWSSCWPTG